MIAVWWLGCRSGPDAADRDRGADSGSNPSNPGDDDDAQLPVIDLSGTLPADLTLSPEIARYYRVFGELVVPVGVVLGVEAGTEVRFTEASSITVYGVMWADGTDAARISFGPDPDAPWVPDFHPSLPEGPPHWGGVHYVDSWSTENRLVDVDIDHAQDPEGAVGVLRSEARLEGLFISGTHHRSVYSDSASVIVRDSTFPTLFAPDESAWVLGLDNVSEYVKGIGLMPAGGHYLIERNRFGVPKGHNDVIDVAGNAWPNEVVQIRGNVFEGGGDDAIDGGGDMLIDGNLFQAFTKDPDNHGSGDSNCTSTGDVAPSVIVLTRNVYLDVDRVANLKRESFGYFEHNTVVGISEARPSFAGDKPPRELPSSAIRLLIPDPVNPDTDPPRDPAGWGAYLDGNVFVDVPEVIFGDPDENGSLGPWTSWLAVEHTLVESGSVFANTDGQFGRSFDYLVGTPNLTASHALAPGSIGIGAGRHGLDLGAGVALQATVCCGGTVDPSVDLEIAGPGIFQYRWRLDGGPWSDVVTITDPRAYLTEAVVPRTATLGLTGLSPGAHTVEVEGRDFAGLATPSTAVSLTVE